MNHARSYLAAALLALAVAAPAPCDRMAAPALDGAKGLVLTIAHVNDTHQRLEPRRAGVRLEVESLGAELESDPKM